MSNKKYETSDITLLGKFTLGSKEVEIITMSSSPEGIVLAPIGSIVIKDTSNGAVFIKRSSASANTGWVEIGQNVTFTTASRPVGMPPGFTGLDTTLNKPIWWNGLAWIDATGTNV